MKKKGNKRMPTPKQKLIHNPIPTSLFIVSLLVKKVSIVPAKSYKQQIHIRKKQKCRDGVMNEFLFWCRHPLVPLLFHEVTSLHPPSFQRNDFSTCSTFFPFGVKPPQKRDVNILLTDVCVMV